MLRRRSIRLRIIVLVLVPVVALLGLYGVVLNLTLGKILTLKQEASIRQLVALPVAHVQVQIGKERTLALEFLASPGHVGLKQLVVQEHHTDTLINQYRNAVQTALHAGPVPKERAAFLAWQTALGKMSMLRTSVASRTLSTVAAAKSYTALLGGGDVVLNQAITPVLTGPLGLQAIDLLTMAKATQAMGEERDLVAADLIGRSFPPADLTLIRHLAVQRSELWSLTLPELDPNLRHYLTTIIPHWAVTQIQQMESVITSSSGNAMALSPRAWTDAQTAYEHGSLKALLKGAAVLAGEATSQADGLALNLILIAALGLLAIGAAIAIGVYVGRGLITQLGALRASAVALSTSQLPDAISRLRAGEDVDVAAEVPVLEAGNDEMGQVREAFNTAARTAVTAAVDEVQIRRSVNDVFRSLARRNQSLLTRQLQLLDGMERRTHDPEDLADLFRVDHLTTRMRRHAEGLLIVAGGSSGRTWREPVPLVDVMRAAVAEVEDYTRIRVTSRTSAAVAGHTVADIIHLLAELVENAATFSPANTPVRIDGDKVARGVVVEIEDRGLGMAQDQLTAVNAVLANPPLFDLSGSDQLGLFIAGQLAKRHEIKVSLRESPYGGIIAVVLIPRSLTVDLDESDLPPALTSIRELGGRPMPQLPMAPSEEGADAAAAAGAEDGYLVGAEAHQRTATLADRVAERTSAADVIQGASTSPFAGSAAGTVWPMPSALVAQPVEERQQITAPQETTAPGETGGSVFMRGTIAPPVWPTGVGHPGDGYAGRGNGGAGTGDAGYGGDASEEVAEATAGNAAPPALPTRKPAAPGPSWDSIWNPAPSQERAGSSITVPADLADLDGLPMRIPQANLAPELRNEPVVVTAEHYLPAPEPPADPEEARNLMSALQRGWERGRTASALDADPADPADPAGSATDQQVDSPDHDSHEEER